MSLKIDKENILIKNEILKDIESMNKLRILYWNSILLLSQILYDDEIILFIDSYKKISNAALNSNSYQNEAKNQLSLFNDILKKNSKKLFDINHNKLFKIKFLTNGNFYYRKINEQKNFSNFEKENLKELLTRKIKKSAEFFDYKINILDLYFGKDNFGNSEIILWIEEKKLSLKFYF